MRPCSRRSRFARERHGAVGARRLHRAPARRLRPRRRALPALRRADPQRRPGRAEPHDLLVPGMPALIRVGHRGAPAVCERQHDRELRRGARDRGRHDRVRRAARRASRRTRSSSRTTTARSTAPPPLTLRGGARALRDGAVRRRAAAARHQAAGPRASGAARRSTPAARASAPSSAPACAACCRASARWRPDIPRGWTVPDVPLVSQTAARRAALYRPPLPRAAPARGALIRAGAIDALVPHWSIVTPRLVDGGARGRR